MLDGLDEQPWAELEHAYGRAVDVPDLLRTLAAGEDDWQEAAGRLHASVYHQGSYFTATPVVVPYLIESLRGDRAPRAGILRLLTVLNGADRSDDAVEGYDPYAFRSQHGDPDYPEARATIAAVRAGYREYLPLLGDDDPQVRSVAARLLVGCPDAAEATRADLASRVHREPDGRTRADQVLALSALTGQALAPLLRQLRDDPAPVVRATAAIELARTDPDHADDTTLRLVADAATLDQPLRAWGGLERLAATAAARLADARPAEAEAILRSALEYRLGHGQRALDPHFWYDGPPAGTDTETLVHHDTVLRELVTVLTPLVFGDLTRRDTPVTRAELTDRQVALLRWTVDYDLPVPVACVPWVDSARMARFLDGPEGPLERPLTVAWSLAGHGETAPTWRWFWELDETKSEELGEALHEALGRQRSPEALLALARDTFSCAYRQDGWPHRPIRLIRAALEPHAGLVAGELRAWAGELDEFCDAQRAWFVIGLLATASDGQGLPVALDPALASAITAGAEVAERLLAPLDVARRSRVIARISNPYWLRKYLDLADPDETARLVVERLLVEAAAAEEPGDRLRARELQLGGRKLLVALGPAAVRPLADVLNAPGSDPVPVAVREAFQGALDELRGEAEYSLSAEPADGGIRLRLTSPKGVPLGEFQVPRDPKAADLSTAVAAVSQPERARLALAGESLDAAVLRRLQSLLSDLGVREVRSGGCTVTRGTRRYPDKTGTLSVCAPAGDPRADVPPTFGR